MKEVNRYYLIPNDGQKSFYKKAIVKVYDDGSMILQSYETDVLRKNKNGSYERLAAYWNVTKNYGIWGSWDEAVDWSPTTGKHIRAFSGMNKKEYMACPMAE